MALQATPVDTDPEVARRQIDRWRAMTLAERRSLIDALHADVERVAIAGIRATRPDLVEVEVRHELARRRYGAELADAAYRDLLPG